MNAVEVHLMLNHIPVLAPFLAVLLILAGMAFRSQPVLRVALAMLALAALVAVPVYFTGEPVEDATKGLPGVAERGIERHEDTALLSLILLGALGLAAAAALTVYRRRPVPGGMSAVLLMASLIVAGQVAWTAHLGGQIRHTELLGGSSAAATQVEREDDDD